MFCIVMPLLFIVFALYAFKQRMIPARALNESLYENRSEYQDYMFTYQDFGGIGTVSPLYNN